MGSWVSEGAGADEVKMVAALIFNPNAKRQRTILFTGAHNSVALPQVLLNEWTLSGQEMISLAHFSVR